MGKVTFQLNVPIQPFGEHFSAEMTLKKKTCNIWARTCGPVETHWSRACDDRRYACNSPKSSRGLLKSNKNAYFHLRLTNQWQDENQLTNQITNQTNQILCTQWANQRARLHNF